jgi:hypothetical protein
MTNLSKGNNPTKKNLKFLSLQGTFLRDESKILISNSQALYIRERKDYTLTKSRFYLVLDAGGIEVYVSSLYPSRVDSVFFADYLGVKYSFDFRESQKVLVKVRKVKPNPLV